MRRWLRPLAFWLLLAFSLALYREWIVRTKSPLFIPLGFFESAVNVTSPEESVRDPATWNDPLEPVAIDIDEFDELVNREGATETKTDVLVTGATFGGFAAAIAAADGGVDVTFVLPDDWRGDMLGQAAAYAGQRHLPDTPTSPLERELRLWPSLQNRQANTNNANGLPSDIVDFFASRIASEKRVTMRDGYAIEAFGRNAEGKPTKALLRPNDGSAPLAVSFSYLIDGTQEGSTMALSGVATTSNWDETPEYDALAKGYTMSGRTMPGIGKRLDGARVAMGVVDRGYHGSFVAPTSVDDCWKPDVSKNPFVAGNAVLRAETIGCTASFSVTSSFEDTVEVFFVNHGNDSIAAAVTIDGTVFNIEMRADPSARFTRIGAFPVGADSPITVTIRNILPTDRLEGIVARKMNANQEATPFTLGEGENATFASSGWDRTDHDIYVHGDGQNAEVIVDGTPHAATPVGFDTFVARGVTLSPGTHELSLTGIEGLGAVLAVPTTPYRALQHIERPVPQTASWTFVPASDGIIAVLAPNESCQASCVMNLTESGGATISLRGDGSGVGGMISAVIPMGTASVRAGTTYVLSTQEGFENDSPLVSVIDEGSDLYGFGVGRADVKPKRAGNMYNVWIRTSRSDSATVTVGAREYAASSTNDWSYVGTEPLPAAGASATSGGGVELLALPNTLIDAYHLPLMLGGGTGVQDLPAGNYRAVSLGTENPGVVSVTRAKDDVVQSIEFIGTEGAFASRKKLIHDASPVTLSPTKQWPQRIVLFESIDDLETSPGTLSGTLLQLLDGTSFAEKNSTKARKDIANATQGLFLFDPFQRGIGPVTMGTQGTETFADHARTTFDDAYMVMRYGRASDPACDENTDPSCDRRKWIREPDVFRTVDSLSPAPLYPDVRRLVALETLTMSGAYAHAIACADCVDRCIKDGDAPAPTCISALDVDPRSILNIPGSSLPVTFMSPKELAMGILPATFRAMRRDGMLGPNDIPVEKTPPARDVSLTLGMFLSIDASNVLAANWTIGATHDASRALRTQTNQLALGGVAGYAAAFSLAEERAPLELVQKSPEAIGRLQRFLVKRGVSVLPLSGSEGDLLLGEAMQWFVLNGRSALRAQWDGERATFTPEPVDREDIALIKMKIFGAGGADTMRDALKRLSNSPTATDVELLKFGEESGFLTGKVFTLNAREILSLPIDESLLIKAEYFLHSTR
jgi:hypothetical protein